LSPPVNSSNRPAPAAKRRAQAIPTSLATTTTKYKAINFPPSARTELQLIEDDWDGEYWKGRGHNSNLDLACCNSWLLAMQNTDVCVCVGQNSLLHIPVMARILQNQYCMMLN
jgi:hypothetical protein